MPVGGAAGKAPKGKNAMARKQREPRRGLPPDPDENWNDPELDWEEVVEQCGNICDKIDDAPSDVWDKAFDFFESVREKAKDMGETIRKSCRVTQGQKNALDNMEAGVDRWLENDHE